MSQHPHLFQFAIIFISRVIGHIVHIREL